METHKRVLGILYIISGSLHILVWIFVSTLLTILFPVIFENANILQEWVLVWILPFIRAIAVFAIMLFSIPSIIGGWGILSGKKWSMTLVLVLGCFKLFSFPIGTALGVYTIWVYTEDHRQTQHT